MPGRGPIPKDPARRSRARDAPGLRVITAVPVPQPPLPEDHPWPQRTRAWWQVWKDSPLSADFTSTDWSFLLDTAFVHARFWEGEHRLAGELRLREAKLGATPEDRARLRITFAQADRVDERRGPLGTSARERYGGLKAIDPPGR